MRVSGFLQEPRGLRQDATIWTLIGRRLRGVLKTINPSYTHSFGATVPELLRLGRRQTGERQRDTASYAAVMGRKKRS